MKSQASEALNPESLQSQNRLRQKFESPIKPLGVLHGRLFTRRSSTCSEFIYSLRLNHAARLLHRRKLLRTGQPGSEVAYACGFRDYTNFARKFRRRFGHSPASHAKDRA